MMENVNGDFTTDMNSSIEEALKKILDTRYEMSFDQSRLTPALEMHAEAKRFLGIEAEIA